MLFDRPNPVNLDGLIENFVAAGITAGTRFNRLETKPGIFYRLFGGDVMITMEYIGRPAESRAFETALSTSFTRLTNPNARALIARHRSHILVKVHRGALPPSPEIAALLAKMDLSCMLQGDRSLDQFRERLSLCSTLSRLAHAMGNASLVYWTSSVHLLQGDVFAKLADCEAPSLLHVHPLLISGGKSGDGRDQTAITTFGAKSFVGREIQIAANPLPWQKSLGLILSFLRIATMKKGYIIPDGDTFGGGDQSFACRVLHIPEGVKSGGVDGPLYRLELLYSREHGFASSDYIAPARTFDDRTVPADVLSDLGRAGPAVVEAVRAKRQMVESVGGRLEVSETAPPRDPWGMPRAFGRKKPQAEA